jgi:hypothetical protein
MVREDKKSERSDFYRTPDDLHRLSNEELGSAIVRTQREYDERMDEGLSIGETREWLAKLHAEFQERQRRGTWTVT